MTAIRVVIEPPSGASSQHEFREGQVTFGRGSGSDIVIGDQSMSRQHARLIAEGDHWVVEDLGARNGTFLNGERVVGRRSVSPGDSLKMGGTMFRVTLPDAEPDVPTLGVLGTTSTIFRPVAEITGAVERAESAPTRVAARLKAINDFHRALSGPVSLDALLELLLERLFATLHPEEGVILLRQADGTMATAASRRLPGATGDLVVSRRLVEEVAGKATAALVSDIEFDERFAGAQSIIASGIRSILAAPIIDAAGCLGMVAIYSRANVRRFGEEDLELLVSLASAAALRIRNVALAEEAAARRVQDRELALAQEIQRAMLPREFPRRQELDLAAAMIPARAVGGDLYDFVAIGDRLWFIVADAAGKGVSAALFMAVTRTLFRAMASAAAGVGQVVTRMNAELARDNERQFFVTAIVGSLDLQTGEVRYVNAGHLPPIRAGASGNPAVLDSGPVSIALGVLDDASYEEQTLKLDDGDVLLLVTDGVTEAVNDRGEMFSDPGLLSAFGTSVAEPAARIVSALVEAVSTFASGAPQEDDITILALRYQLPLRPSAA